MRIYWSNLINRDDIVNYPLKEEDICFTLADLRKVAERLKDNFKYVYDRPKELFDSMRFPAQCYKDFCCGELKDDCDGFAATLYHVAISSGLEGYLLTYIPEDLTKGHTVFVLKKRYLIAIFDYTDVCVSDNFKSVFNIYLSKNNINLKCYNISAFNYEKGKYQIVEENI